MQYFNPPRIVASPPPSLPSYEDFNVSKSFVIHHPRSPFSGFNVNAGYPTSLFSSRFGPAGSWHLSLIAHPFLTAPGWSLGEEKGDDADDLNGDTYPAVSPAYISNPEQDIGTLADPASDPNDEQWETPKQVPGDVLDNIQETQERVTSCDDTFYIEAVFNSDDEVHGSISLEFATMTGEILKHDSTPMIGGNTHTVRFSESEAGADLTHILFTIRVISSSRPAGFPLYDPVQVTSLLARMLGGENVQDVKYVLYRRSPTGEATQKDVGYVYADKKFLSLKCNYFQKAFTQDLANKRPQDDQQMEEASPPPEDASAPFQMPPFDENYDCGFDSDLEDGEDGDHLEDDEESGESGLPTGGTIIHMPDSAYHTWKAMIFYLYTGNIRFAPLKSSSSSTESDAQRDSKGNEYKGLKPVSCKSMFRLAEKLGIPALEYLALQHLKSQLSIVNIWAELLSLFTSRFEKIKRLEMDFLIENWDIVRASGQVEEHLEILSQGRIPHARPIFGELFKRLKPEPSTPVAED